MSQGYHRPAKYSQDLAWNMLVLQNWKENIYKSSYEQKTKKQKNK